MMHLTFNFLKICQCPFKSLTVITKMQGMKIQMLVQSITGWSIILYPINSDFKTLYVFLKQGISFRVSEMGSGKILS